MKLVDAHTHVNSEFYKDDWREVLERALQKEVACVLVGTNRVDSKENIGIAKEFDSVYATVGMHPTEKDRFNYEIFKELAENEKVVAIGECGLDYYREENKTEEDKERQEGVFREQIRLAQEVRKPLMLHLRTSESYDRAIEIAEKLEGDYEALIFHFYSGSRGQTERILKIPKTYVTVGGVITFTSDYDEVLKMIPTDRMMLETDAPFLAPVPHRGERNEPAFIIKTAKRLGEIKGLKTEELAEITTRTAVEVLGVDNKI